MTPVAAQAARHRHQRMVSLACEAMRSSSGPPLSLADVCERLRVTPAELDDAFRAALGAGIGQFVKAMRLSAVRGELARRGEEEATVYETAARWGFWHYGRFSSDYRRHFAESPCETLRRARESRR